MGIKPKLRTFDLSMIVVSLVIGIGIFRTPTLVANQLKLLLSFSWPGSLVDYSALAEPLLLQKSDQDIQ